MQAREFDAIGNAGYGQEFEKLLNVIFLRNGLSSADARTKLKNYLSSRSNAGAAVVCCPTRPKL